MTSDFCAAGRPRDRRDPGLCLAALIALAIAVTACVKKPIQEGACQRADLSGCPISELSITGNHALGASEIEGSIATTRSATALFGAIVIEYEPFDRFVLERDLARIERRYRARGYYEAHARAARVIRLSDEAVRVEIAVDEGQPVRTAAVDVGWKDWRLDEHTRDVTAAIADVRSQLAAGAPLDEEKYDAMKKAMVRAMTDRGFAYGSVEGEITVDLATHAAAVKLELELGPHCTFGRVQIVGLDELPEGSVRTAIDIDEGDEYATSTLEAAEYALADYGVFGSVNIEPMLSKPGEPRLVVVPVKFTLQPAQLRSIKLGIGAELGTRLEAHVVGGWENRNFLGGLRRLVVEARPGIELYPTSLGNFRAPTVAPLVELHSRFEFKQPQAFEARTNFLLRGAVNVYHLQQESSQDTIDECYPEGGAATGTPETTDCTIVGYSEYVGTVGFERLFQKSRLYLAQLAHWQIDDPFVYYDTGKLPPGFSVVTVRHLETIAALDYRLGADGKRDAIHPNQGFYVGANLQLAGGLLGGDTDDIRVRPEVRAYVPISKKVTLGFRLATGFLFPRNYGDSLDDETAPVDRENEQAFTRDMQLLSFRAFFSGGPYSNRGYPTNSIGPRAVVLDTRDQRKVIASGGRTLWESSLELRFPVVGDLGTAIFADASDVTRGVGELRLTHPHVSVGLGLRYDTPVGPLRFDVGYRVPCLQITGTEALADGTTQCHELPDVSEVNETGPGVVDEGAPSDFLGVPIAVSIVFGEAF